MNLRYTGTTKTTFMAHGVGELEPGTEFPLPDAFAEGFLARSDIEPADPQPQAKARKQTPKPGPGDPAGQQADEPTMTA